MDAMSFALLGCRDGSIAHSDLVNAVHRDVLVLNQVTHHAVGHLLRAGDGSLAAAGAKALHFDDVALLVFHRRRQVIDRALGLLAKQGLTRAEANFNLRGRLELVNVRDCLLHRTEPVVGLLRGLVGELCAIAGVYRVLVSLIGLGRSQADAFRRARVHVFDQLGVAGGELIGFSCRCTYFLRAKGFRCPQKPSCFS